MVRILSPARLFRGGDLCFPSLPLAIRFQAHILFAVSLLSTLGLYAQSNVKLRGRVVNAGTGQPIPHVQVLIQGTTLGTVTDAHGRFHFSNLLIGHYTLETQHIGYTSAQKKIRILRDQATLCHFRLNESVLISRGVSIEADARQSSGHTVTLSQKAIAQSNAQDLGELLQRLPQVEVQRAGGPGSPQRVSLRGSQSNQVLILLDGAPMNDPATGEADLGTLPLSMIENVEVIKGGASHEYGSGAMGGVIKIRTRQAPTQQIGIETGAGSYGLYTLKPHLSLSNTVMNLKVAGQLQRVKGDSPFSYLAPGYTDPATGTVSARRRNADAQQWHLFARVGWKSPVGQATLGLQTGRSERGLPGKIHVWSPWARTMNTQKRLSFTWESRAAARLHSTINLNWSETETENKNIVDAEGDPADTKIASYHHIANATLLQFLGQSKAQPFDFCTIQLSISGRHQRYNDQSLLGAVYAPVGRATDNTWGTGLRSTFQTHVPLLPGQFSLQTALRYDAFDIAARNANRIETQWSPGIELGWQSQDGQILSIFGRWNRSFRVPTLNDLFYQEARVQGRPDLLPERAELRELNLTIQLQHPLPIQIQATAFNQRIDDMIHWRMGFHQIFYPINTDAKITGQEYRLNMATRGDQVTWDCTYTRLNALNMDDHHALHGRYLIYRPLWTVKSTVSWQRHGWRAQWFFRHTGPRYYTESNTSRFDAYALHDISLSRSVHWQSMQCQITAQCLNLFDVHYELLERMPLPGREYRINLSISR